MPFILNADVIPDAARREQFDSTLRQWADEIIPAIEMKYGKINPNFEFIGVELLRRKPQTFFPAFGAGKLVTIRLNITTVNNDAQALFQLAHECVHLLDPTKLGNAPVLEEGLASINSIEYVRRLSPIFGNGDNRYDMAAAVAQEALSINPDFVRNLRGADVPFAEMTPELILQECTGLNAGLAEALCAKFQTWNPFIDLSRIQSPVPIRLSFGSIAMVVGNGAGLPV